MKEIHKPRMSASMAMVTDANGNPSTSTNITTTELSMLNNIRTNVQTQIDNITSNVIGDLDYANAVSAATTNRNETKTYTAPSNGIFIINNTEQDQAGRLKIGKVDVNIGANSSYGRPSAFFLPLKKGDVVTYTLTTAPQFVKSL